MIVNDQCLIDNLVITIQRKRIKHIYIRIKDDTSIVVSAPKRATNKELLIVINERMNWIKAKVRQHRTQQKNNRTKDNIIQTGEWHYFLGKAYALTLIDDSDVNRVEIVNTNDDGNHRLILHCQRHDKREQVLEDWYRKEMLALLPEITEKWQIIVGKNANEWRIKKMKTRWGSCNIKARRIWLNLALIRMPLECIEHVIVHELVHLIERGHNARFYGLMDVYMPKWREYDALMKQYSTMRF